MDIKGIIEAARDKLEEIKDIKTERGQQTYMFAQDLFDLIEKEILENIEIKKDIFIVSKIAYEKITQYVKNIHEKKITQISEFALIYGEEADENKINKIKKELQNELDKNKEDYEFVLSLFKEVYIKYLEPQEIIEELEKKGYKAYCIDKIELIYNPLGIEKIADKYLTNGYDIVTNGTFYGSPKNSPYGILIKDGKYLLEKKIEEKLLEIEKIKNRGGIAILNDESIKYDIANFNYEDVKKKFKKNDLKIKDFMGGGALLIQKGNKVTSKELGNIQQFFKGEATNNGFGAEQMRDTYHLLIGECNGYNFVIVPRREKYEFEEDEMKVKTYEKDLATYNNFKNKDKADKKPIKPNFDEGKNKKFGENLQKDIYEIGFTPLIKYDGGKAFYFKTRDYYHNGGKCDNHCGWAIKARNLK